MTHAGRGGGFFSPPLPRVIAHRGLALEAPENTLAAFAAALDAGATHIETDVHSTRDGIAVVLHDPDLARLLGARGENALVGSLTLDELRRLGGAELEICTLLEALQTFPSALFNIDVKADAAAGPTADAVRAADASSRVLVTSFRDRRRRAALAALGPTATSASAEILVPALLALAIGAVPLARRILAPVDAVQIPERILGIATTTPRMLERWHRAGVEVHVWTINDERAMQRLLDAGADGIVTDRCDLLVRLLEQRRRDR